MTAPGWPEVVPADVVIVGGGVAGMTAALHAGRRRVVLLSDRPVGRSGSSFLAQGGIAVAMGPEDSPERHARDTLEAADGLADPAVVRMVTREGPRRIREILALGARFDRDDTGRLAFGREGAHSLRRVLHANGDATGAELSRTLAEAVARSENIRIVHGHRADALLVAGGRLAGVATVTADGSHRIFAASSVILATGGLGHLFQRTTNPLEARGSGLALAAWAGAELADLEMVQFHPTALADGSDPAPLLTEALRGEGAVLVDGEGRPVMAGVHPAGDLAPRDVVARVLWRLLRDGRPVFLDARPIGDGFRRRFPTVFELCRRRGLDPTATPIPVAPAAHYHMGGIVVDEYGRSTVPGLWAAGEVACTGLHGANRLASNSLLEALVYGARAGEDVAARLAAVPRPGEVRAAWQELVEKGMVPGPPRGERDRVAEGVRAILWRGAGVERDAVGLRRALDSLEALAGGTDSVPNASGDANNSVPNASGDVDNSVPNGADAVGDARRVAEASVAGWILRSALERRSSRGAHLRTDADPADDGLYRVIVRDGRVWRRRLAWMPARTAGRAQTGR